MYPEVFSGGVVGVNYKTYIYSKIYSKISVLVEDYFKSSRMLQEGTRKRLKLDCLWEKFSPPWFLFLVNLL